MKAAAHKHKVDFKKFLDEQKMIKPVFEAVGDKAPVDGCFTDYFYTESISRNSGSNNYFSGKPQKKNNDEQEKNNEESHVEDNEQLESHKFCISFQSMFAE